MKKSSFSNSNSSNDEVNRNNEANSNNIASINYKVNSNNKSNSDKPTKEDDLSVSKLAAFVVLNNKDGKLFPFGYGLKSIYDNGVKNHVTNKTPTFTDVLDYIFCNAKTCKVIQKVPVSAIFTNIKNKIEKEMNRPSSSGEIPVLPCLTWPSDHLMLAVDVELL